MLSSPFIFNLFSCRRQQCLASDVAITLKVIWFFSACNRYLLIIIHLATGESYIKHFSSSSVWMSDFTEFINCIERHLSMAQYYWGPSLVKKTCRRNYDEVFATAFAKSSWPANYLSLPCCLSMINIFLYFLQEIGYYNDF